MKINAKLILLLPPSIPLFVPVPLVVAVWPRRAAAQLAAAALGHEALALRAAAAALRGQEVAHQPGGNRETERWKGLNFHSKVEIAASFYITIQ